MNAGRLSCNIVPGRFLVLLVLIGASLFSADELHAARIAELTETRIGEQMWRFITLQDPSVRYALAGSLLLGVSCGLLGSFIVVRKMALVGDTLSHAVLPGVAVGFLWNMSKDPIAIFVGATVAGLLGTLAVNLIRQTTNLKEDTALGLVLATFFAVGICMLTRIQNLPTGNKSGIDKFLFGQAAALGADDIRLMLVITVLAVACVILLYKEFLITSFDPSFAGASGFPAQLIHYTLMLLLAFAVVIALQAVGVVLVSAMLITPAATAYLLTDRMNRMLVLASVFGMIAGAAGAFFSFLSPSLPTGPFMVLSASLLFVLAFLFGPRYGLVLRWWRQRSRAQRVQRENTLKSIYRVLENNRFRQDSVSLHELARFRGESEADAHRQTAELRRHGLATVTGAGDKVYLTPSGSRLAREIVRNHRLWELYLTNAASIAPDHVHDDAEKIEHVLGEDVVRQLERRLGYATEDPHGRAIPSVEEIHAGEAEAAPDRSPGYGGMP